MENINNETDNRAIKQEVQTEMNETKPNIKAPIPFLADLIKLKQQSKKSEEGLSCGDHGSHDCKVEGFTEEATELENVEQPVLCQDQIQETNEVVTSITSNSDSCTRGFTVEQARLLFQTVLDNDSDVCSESDTDCCVSDSGNLIDNTDGSSCEVCDNQSNDFRSTNKGKRKQTANNNDGLRDKRAKIVPAVCGHDNDNITWNEVLDGKTKPIFEFNKRKLNVKPDLCLLQTPMDYLKIFYDDEIVNCIITSINDTAKMILQENNPLRKHSHLSNWSPVTKYEWLKFTSIIIAMELNPRHSIKDYWCTTPNFYTPWYATMMPRNQFVAIFYTMLHICEPDAEGVTKIEPFIEMLVKKFQAAFYPHENVSINKMVIGRQDRFQHRQYKAEKPPKDHIKAFGLCDSLTGYVVNLKIYFGKNTACNLDTDFTSSDAVELFATLLSVLGPGHHIFSNRFYTSKALIDYLHANNFNYTGTLDEYEVGFPPEVKHLRLQHQQIKWFMHGDQTLCVAWRDNNAKKRLAVSTKAAVETVQSDKKKQNLKPRMIQDYNVAMSGCGKMNQMIGYYNHSKTRMWLKIYYWIFEIAQVNAHILHTTCQTLNGGSKMSLKDFKMSLIDSANLEAAASAPESVTNCLPKACKKSHGRNHLERITGAKHLIAYVGKNRDCVFCSLPTKRHRSSFICSGCTNKPHLCPKVCFAAYHK